jgi:hypothetical protein
MSTGRQDLAQTAKLQKSCGHAGITHEEGLP